jgi:CheY-like chemotaxis protein
LPQAAPKESQEQAAIALEELRGSASVLVVEDDPMVRKAATRILSRYGYVVLEAENADQAIQASEEHGHIDLLVSDIVLPGLGGLELSRRLCERYPDLLTIYMSGYASDEAGILDEDPSAVLLRKPFGPELLLREIHRALS